MSRDIAVFIHAASIDGVEKRIEQYTSILEKSGLLDVVKEIFICYVGNSIFTSKSTFSSIQYVNVSKDIHDFEVPTQQLLWNYANVNPNKKILYLHTKGVGKELNLCIEDWINYMLYFCVEQWEKAIELLNTYDTVGVDLLEQPMLHYSGNFWWANASYIKTLPSPLEFTNLNAYPNPLNSTRHNQEFWICYRKQKHSCLWQSNINCYERHLHRYLRNQYDLKLINKIEEMLETLCIFFLTGNAREQFLPTIIENLSKCKYKQHIHFLVLTDVNHNEIKYNELLNGKDISYTICSFPLDDNYMRKVRYALEFVKTKNIPYMMKHDNDILCSSYMYDFLFENKDILLDEKNLLLTPTLTSGIPTVEQFLFDFCSESERNEMYSLFLQYRFGNTWGVNYTSLNQHTLFSEHWNPAEYFQGVGRIQHPYRGIHPIRMYDRAIYKLNDLVLKYKNEIMGKRNIYLIYDNSCPYFCNSIYLIRSDIYNKIMNTPQLFVDSYDEVPINQYKNIFHLNIVYTQNGAAIHPIYNSIPGNDAYEKEFMLRYESGSSK